MKKKYDAATELYNKRFEKYFTEYEKSLILKKLRSPIKAYKLRFEDYNHKYFFNRRRFR